MMEIPIPDAFIVRECPECKTRHAPVRDCLNDDDYYDREEDYWKYSGNGE